jgi:hypothetical protein
MAVAALIDGAWAFTGHIQTELTNRTWDAPYPWGTLGQCSTRILYGGSWALMIGAEALAVIAAYGNQLERLGDASYRSEWIMPLDLPACPELGAYGGCGVGVGGFSYLQIRPRGRHWWLEGGGGWIQQRVLNDALRTVAESSWVLTPITALYELETDPNADVSVRFFSGPGLFFGMRAGHVHPTPRGQDLFDVPWHEMHLLDAGIGPGARVEGRVVFKRHLTLEGDLVVSPFLLGGAPAKVSADVAPLRLDDGPSNGDGISVWRKVGAGIGWDDPSMLPFKLTLAFFGAELSDRSIDRIGYRGAMMRFDIPLKLSKEE